jgi:hypothetical protein
MLPVFMASSVVLLSALAASAHPTETGPENILAAVRDCAASFDHDRLNSDKLVARGWSRKDVTMTDGNASPPQQFFGKDPKNPLIRIVPNSAGNPAAACVVEGWLAPATKYSAVTAKMHAELTSTGIFQGKSTYEIDRAEVMELSGQDLGNSDFRILVTPSGETQ